MPTTGDDPTTLEVMWSELREKLRHVFVPRESFGMMKSEYMNIHTLVYNYCTSVSVQNNAVGGLLRASPRTRTRNTPGVGQHHGAEFIGHELYRKMDALFTEQVEEIVQKRMKEAQGAQGLSSAEDVLEYYAKKWEDFEFAARLINGMFAYLNRHWVRREVEEGRDDIYEIYVLALVKWKRIMFAQTEDTVIGAVIAVINRDRNSERIDNALLKNVINSFVTLGIRDDPLNWNEPHQQMRTNVHRPTHDPQREANLERRRDYHRKEEDKRKKQMQVYCSSFEQPMLEDAKKYYQRESQAYLGGANCREIMSFVDYMQHVDKRFAEEEDRVARYMHESTKQPLCDVLNQVLVCNNLDRFQSELNALLRVQKHDDLGLMYRLCARVENGHSMMRATFEAHIKEQGLAAVNGLQQTRMALESMPQSFVRAVLDTHRMYHKVVATSFMGDKNFIKALDNACHKFVNENALTAGRNNEGRSAEMVAMYANQLLKKSPKNPHDSEMQEKLEDVITAFKYVEDKDVFFKFYQNRYSMRLVQDLSGNPDDEEFMIKRLQDVCGFEYVAKLRKMKQDIELAPDLTKNFKETNNSDIDLRAMVLTMTMWPFSGRTNHGDIQLPPELAELQQKFKEYYLSKHKNRVLSFHYPLCRGELIMHGANNKKYTLVASTMQIVVLTALNNAPDEQMTVRELKAATKMESAPLCDVVAGLSTAGILLVTEPAADAGIGSGSSSPVPSSTELPQSGESLTMAVARAAQSDKPTYSDMAVVAVNTKFTSRKMKIEIYKAGARREQRAEVDRITQQNSEDRKHILQACIVRVMKARKVLHHQQLIAEVLQQTQNRFKPKVPAIKKEIDSLIEKEYLRRSETSNDTYEYIS